VFGFWVWGLGFWVLGFGFGVLGFGFWGFGLGVWGLGVGGNLPRLLLFHCDVHEPAVCLWGLGFGVQGLGFRGRVGGRGLRDDCLCLKSNFTF